MDEAFTGLEHELGIAAACRLTGRSRATHYRRLKPPPVRAPRTPRVQPAELTAEERDAVLELMNSAEYAELPPAQIWARELDTGRYHCSVSTMYRILRERGQSGERRRQAVHPANTVPELVADGPSQVFTWKFEDRMVARMDRSGRCAFSWSRSAVAATRPSSLGTLRRGHLGTMGDVGQDRPQMVRSALFNRCGAAVRRIIGATACSVRRLFDSDSAPWAIVGRGGTGRSTSCP
ncbi:hypothetical protein [Streptacidiphilus sp. BW17]|uniref:hypothetical protein n=1 Tax=Streptacidiphilus sp. BW17 TaxID=3156274 RepID=UPI00351157B5